MTLILVCGSRDWGDEDFIADVLADYTTELNVTIMHGACSRRVEGQEMSADMLADAVAEFYGFRRLPILADWHRHGRAAGPIRNRQMLDREPDRVIAFQRNGSRGTQDTIDEARRRGIPVEVYTS